MSEREMSIRFESTLYDHDIFHEPQYLEIPLHENLPPVTEDLRNDYIESDRLQRRLYPDWSRLPFIYRRTVEYQRAPIGPAIVAEPFIDVKVKLPFESVTAPFSYISFGGPLEDIAN